MFLARSWLIKCVSFFNELTAKAGTEPEPPLSEADFEAEDEPEAMDLSHHFEEPDPGEDLGEFMDVFGFDEGSV